MDGWSVGRSMLCMLCKVGTDSTVPDADAHWAYLLHTLQAIGKTDEWVGRWMGCALAATTGSGLFIHFLVRSSCNACMYGRMYVLCREFLDRCYCGLCSYLHPLKLFISCILDCSCYENYYRSLLILHGIL